MLYIHTSNQLEELKKQYANIVKIPLSDVLTTETVVVQNAGMARWLSMQMAQSTGVSANTKFLFPAEFMWKLLRLVSPDIPEHSQCAPDTLRFHIFEELIHNVATYPELHHYILNENNTTNQLSAWDLSCQLAQLLDQYLFYRSDWIDQWENDSSKQHLHWQARLWNKCVKDKHLLHWLALQEQFKTDVKGLDQSLLAERVIFFSMSALSPGYVDLLGEISKKTDIHIFIINPCEEVYWGDIKSPKAHSKQSIEEQNYSEIGNPLLASLGKQGRDFIDKLLEIDHQDNDDLLYTEQTLPHTLLEQIQYDIYNLENPTFNQDLANFDGSIQFNSCHTAMREVEVLHDQILAQLDSDKNLAPSDFVVMMPDIEKYAPYIEAVFADTITSKNQQKLPFSIADRDPQNIFKLIQALNKLFALPDSRFDVEAVFELLEYEDIREHFGINQDQLDYCRELALSTNIRWGISAKTRQQNDLPNTEEHTWKYALDSMLLGYSLADNDSGRTLFKAERPLDLLPYNEIEGSNALVLANFKRFTDAVFTINDWQLHSYSLDKWITETTTLIKKFSPDNSDQQRIFKSINDLQTKADLAEFEAKLSFVVFQKMLQQSLSSISANEKYLGYGITFCALVPMRSIPFKVVVLMGMNDGEFPRQDTRPSFDLMADQSRKGDRSRRDEDRYLFLESILAAREKLIISYIGQSIKDNTDSAPSILISELLDTITINSGIEAKDWIVKHPLQAFSHRYFSTDVTGEHTLFSYATQYLHLNETRTNETNLNHSAFISEPLANLDDSYKHLSLNDLIEFFKNPARAFLKTRFGIQTYDNESSLHTREPFEIESFKDREIRNLIVANDIDCDDKQLIARAKGLLPYGEIGNEIYAKEKHTVDAFNEQLPDVEEHYDESSILFIGEYQINIKLNKLSHIGRYVKQVGQPYAVDYINLWITHLCLNAIAKDNPNLNTETYFYSPETSFVLSAVVDAEQQLSQLLDYYWQGLHFPLRFFPKTGFALYRKNGKINLTEMHGKWNGNNGYAGEKDTFEHWLLHRNIILDKDQPDDDFMQISEHFFGNMFAHLN